MQIIIIFLKKINKKIINKIIRIFINLETLKKINKKSLSKLKILEINNKKILKVLFIFKEQKKLNNKSNRINKKNKIFNNNKVISYK